MYNRILVAVDGSDACNRALGKAIDIALRTKAAMRILHVVPTPVLDYGYKSPTDREETLKAMVSAGEKVLKDATDSVRKQGIPAEGVIVELSQRSIADEILAHAEQWPADMIVLGTHPRSTDSAVGPNSRSVLAHARVPVLSLNAAWPTQFSVNSDGSLAAAL